MIKALCASVASPENTNHQYARLFLTVSDSGTLCTVIDEGLWTQDTTRSPSLVEPRASKGQMSIPTNLDLLEPSFILVKLAFVTEVMDG